MSSTHSLHSVAPDVCAVADKLTVLPAGLELREKIETLEMNGFVLVDFAADGITIRYFRWKLGMDESLLDQLEPFETTVLPRPGA